MAKKKTKHLTEEERAVLAEARKAKTEAKEKAAAEKAAMTASRKQWYTFSAIAIGAALILSLFGIRIFGEENYWYSNVASFVLMAICGLCMMKATNYEPDEKKANRTHFTGMAFAAISAMMIVTQIIQKLTGQI